MNILDRLHMIIARDVAKLFTVAKRDSIIATQAVSQAEKALEEARKQAIASAELARQHAEAAAAQARSAAEELAIEARAAAERVAFHSSKLEPKEPTV